MIRNGQAIRLILLVLAVAAIASATLLEVLGDEASSAWGVVAGVIGLLAGQHLPPPAEPKP